MQLAEIIGSVVEMCAPVKAKPAHIPLDGLNIFHRFLAGVGVVETQMTLALVLLGNAKVQADGLGVADVQEAVRLRRETGDNAGVLARGKVIGNNLPDEIKGLVGRSGDVSGHI